MEHHDLVQTVQELRLEGSLELIHYIALHLLMFLCLIAYRDKSKLLRVNYTLCPCIGGHDYDGVLEIHLSSLGIRYVSVIKYLKENVEHIAVSLLYLVKQHNRIRIGPDLLTELSALLKAYITRR